MFFRIARNFLEATFISRENRFTLLLQSDKGTIRAFLPNTGRLEEFLIPGRKFYIRKKDSGKLMYRCISTLYRNNFILLDTHMTQKVFRKFIENGLIDFLNPESITQITEEYPVNEHRIDLAVKLNNRFQNESGSAELILMETKSCTLLHNGVGMFPDAPSKRALEHIRVLGEIKRKGIETYIVFLIPHPKAEIFIPNIHTDPEFSSELLSEGAPTPLAYRFKLIDPVTVDLTSLGEVKIDRSEIIRNPARVGSYVLILENRYKNKVRVGSLGNINLDRGYYVYVGSALNNLESRINRHKRKTKNKRWHIDYIVPEYTRIVRIYKIRSVERLEGMIVGALKPLSNGEIKGFGAGDSQHTSHLLYFKDPPHYNSCFIERILDFLTLPLTEETWER